MSNNVCLAVEPVYHNFNVNKQEDAEEALGVVLDNHCDNTENFKLTAHSDVFLHTNGKIQGTYQLTIPALAQLCSRLAPGLSQAVLDLSGVRPRKGNNWENAPTDAAMCSKMINAIIKCRFDDLLSGCSMIIDHSTNTVEGIVGKSYKLFTNKDMLDRIRTFVSDLDEPASFCEAALAGRRLHLRFKNADPLFEIPCKRNTSEPFFGGYHFVNSETGECSVKAAALIIRQWCDNKAISEFREGGKLFHVSGTSFDQRFSGLLERVQLKAQEATKYRDRVLNMIATNLGLGGTNANNEERMKKIHVQLHRQGLLPGFCTSVISRVLASGSYRADSFPRTANPLKVYQQRTEYDLFNALTHEAKSTSLDNQEKAEQIGYKMLTGKFKIV